MVVAGILPDKLQSCILTGFLLMTQVWLEAGNDVREILIFQLAQVEAKFLTWPH